MSKNKLKAEMWDKTQYFLSNFYDRMMHFAIFYDGQIDFDIMKKAVKHVVDNMPVLHSSYCPSFVRPYWKENDDYSAEDITGFEIVEDLEKSVEKFILGDISHKDKLQMKCKVFKCGDKSAYAALINHMCFDGSDLKYVQYKIIECYNAYAETGSFDSIEIKNGTRKVKQIYERMEPEASKRAKGLYNNASKMGLKKSFKFTDDTDCTKRLICEYIDPVLFDQMKSKGKEFEASINDMLLAAYFRAYVKEAGLTNDELVGITSMMDLRRHFVDKKGTAGCTNMTAFMPCKLEGIGNTFEETLTAVVKNTKKQKEDNCAGLYGVPLLALAYKLFVFDGIARFAIKLGYENPLMQMSNLGLVKPENVNLKNCNVYDVLITGAVKYKPFFQLTCTTLNGNMKLCVAEKCSDRDEKLIKDFLLDIINEIKTFVKG